MQHSKVELGRIKQVWVVVPSGCNGGEVVNFERDGSDLGERRLHF